MKHTLAGLLLLIAAVARLGAAEQCGVCHPESRVAFENSVHAQEQVGCISCHGGNPDSLEVDQAHRGRFSSLTDRSGVPALCAGCHSDLSQMRAYNLAVDQFSVYQTSQHGKALARGDDRVAVCTDCHGIHEILAPQNPRSWVNARNLPATCAKCHADETLMSAYGIDSGVMDDYLSSIHGQALLKEGNLAAPNCTSCHGVHGATPPGVGDIDKVCGFCHVQARRAFLEGPHYAAMQAASLPECESCHSNHAIERLGAADIPSQCTQCHDEGSEQVALGQKIETLIHSAEDQVAAAEALVERAERVPLEVEDYLSRIEEAQTHLTEALPLVHSVSLAPVERATRRARSIGEEVQHELYAELDRPVHLGLSAFWFYLLMTVAILVTYRKRLIRGGQNNR